MNQNEEFDGLDVHDVNNNAAYDFAKRDLCTRCNAKFVLDRFLRPLKGSSHISRLSFGRWTCG